MDVTAWLLLSGPLAPSRRKPGCYLQQDPKTKVSTELGDPQPDTYDTLGHTSADFTWREGNNTGQAVLW